MRICAQNQATIWRGAPTPVRTPRSAIAWRCAKRAGTSRNSTIELASSGLRTTQFSILIRLRLAGPMTINALAKALVMDRTTLGRNILPLEREGLIDV